jgi:hypothetical protein
MFHLDLCWRLQRVLRLAGLFAAQPKKPDGLLYFHPQKALQAIQKLN